MAKKVFLIFLFSATISLIAINQFTGAFSKPLSAKKILPVPFVPQVNQNDETLARIGCEEAAITMAVQFFNKGRQASAKKEMLSLIEYENHTLGGHPQIGAQTIAKILENQYYIKSKVVKFSSTDKLKQSLEKNEPIAVPVLAKELRNPFYNEEGYHVIILTGFNQNGFYAHDPGTGAGNNYYYPNENIINAIYNIETKEKEVLIIQGEK